ncbi:hypothetical protein CWI36_1034p0010 [Hamiltosporidium magnivora]|uniref:Uncharacterized protein n=1 Tax=Hamiltosporidium magnivora TaxID=148818 RepID=A0A4Q9L5S3_9MICR|nr:hypothetical protein CWI36_1034p0010 [Hamiltosporidium magnivora]
MSYTGGVKKKATRKIQKNNDKPRFIEYIPDIVIYHDINSLIYNMALKKRQIDDLSDYFSNIFSKYLNMETMQTELTPKIKKNLSKSVQQSQEENKYELFFQALILIVKDHINNYKESFCQKHKKWREDNHIKNFLLGNECVKLV